MDQKSSPGLTLAQLQLLKIPIDTFKDLSVWDKQDIEEIVKQVKAPYKPFKKRVKLSDLVQVLNEIWEEDED